MSNGPFYPEDDEEDETYVPSSFSRRLKGSPSPNKKRNSKPTPVKMEASQDSHEYSLEFEVGDEDTPMKSTPPLGVPSSAIEPVQRGVQFAFDGNEFGFGDDEGADPQQEPPHDAVDTAPSSAGDEGMMGSGGDGDDDDLGMGGVEDGGPTGDEDGEGETFNGGENGEGMDLEAYLSSAAGMEMTEGAPMDPSAKGLDGMSPSASRMDTREHPSASVQDEYSTSVASQHLGPMKRGDKDDSEEEEDEEEYEEEFEQDEGSPLNTHAPPPKVPPGGLRAKMERELRDELGFDILDIEPNELQPEGRSRGKAVSKKEGDASAVVGAKKKKKVKKKAGVASSQSASQLGFVPDDQDGIDIHAFVEQHSFEKVSAVRKKAFKNAKSTGNTPSPVKRAGGAGTKSKKNAGGPVSVGSKEHISSLLSQVGSIQKQLSHLTSEEEDQDDDDDDGGGDVSTGVGRHDRMARINSVIASVRGNDDGALDASPPRSKAAGNKGLKTGSGAGTVPTSSAIAANFVAVASSPKSKIKSLEDYVITLKRDLKRRDDRLQRMTEQNLSLNANVENLKREVFYYEGQVKEKIAECEIKDQKLTDAIKAKKRAVTKANKLTDALDGVDKLQDALADYRDREKMLMESIEVLSRQNEELASELNKSLNREIHLRTQQVSRLEEQQSVAGGGSVASDAVSVGGGRRRAVGKKASDAHATRKKGGRGGVKLPDVY